MEAYNFYWIWVSITLGWHAKNKGVLPAVKVCYIIAAENLHSVRSMNSLTIDNENKVN